MTVGPWMSSPELLAGIHAREADDAPNDATEGLADHMEREVDAMAALHDLPSLDGDDDTPADIDAA